MKKRKILYLFPLAALVLSGCTFQEGWETAKSWTNDNVFTPVVQFFKDILGIEDKKEEKQDDKPSGGEQGGGEQGGEQGGGEQGSDVVNVLSVSLNLESKTLEIGESFQLTATVLPTNATNKNVTWSATGEGIVSVDDGLVTALRDGTSVVTVKTVDGNKTASCTVKVNAAVDPHTKPEGAVDMEYSTADNIGDHQDKWCYFNDPEWWSGASATVNEGYSYEGKVVFDYTYAAESSPSAADWTVQILKKDTSLTNGAPYKLSFDLKSNKAGSIKVNGAMKDIIAGDNHIEVAYVENNIPYASGLSFQIVLSLAFGSARLELTNIAWTESIAAPEGVVVNPVSGGYIVAFAAVAGATSYKAYYVDYATGDDVDNEVVTNGGTLTKVSSLADGKYKVFVTAFKGEEESERSTSFGVIQIGTPEAVVPAGGPKTAMEFGEEHDGSTGALSLPDDKFVYWNDQGWCGSVITVDENETYTDEGSVHAKYVVASEYDPGWGTGSGCTFCFQIFYKNTSLTAGTTYTLSYTLTSAKAGTVTANGQNVVLEAGVATNVSVDYVEVANNASFALVFPSSMGDNTISFNNISWVAK
ncbi:MAG: Ig-like domain-containing protein [Bacilli bacterium]|nr:Ig-like domain-containing protein [Bacilli bacterium]